MARRLGPLTLCSGRARPLHLRAMHEHAAACAEFACGSAGTPRTGSRGPWVRRRGWAVQPDPVRSRQVGGFGPPHYARIMPAPVELPPARNWRALGERALDEGLGPGDVTSPLVVPPDAEAPGVIEARQDL